MTTTTIKVDNEVRDRLAEVARSRGTTMTSLLNDVSFRLEGEQAWANIEAAYDRLQRADPEGWAEYLTELAEWDNLGSDPGSDPGDATEEWPEYNQ